MDAGSHGYCREWNRWHGSKRGSRRTLVLARTPTTCPEIQRPSPRPPKKQISAEKPFRETHKTTPLVHFQRLAQGKTSQQNRSLLTIDKVYQSGRRAPQTSCIHITTATHWARAPKQTPILHNKGHQPILPPLPSMRGDGTTFPGRMPTLWKPLHPAQMKNISKGAKPSMPTCRSKMPKTRPILHPCHRPL